MKKLVCIIVLIVAGMTLFFSCSEEKDYSGQYNGVVYGNREGGVWKKDIILYLEKVSGDRYICKVINTGGRASDAKLIDCSLVFDGNAFKSDFALYETYYY